MIKLETLTKRLEENGYTFEVGEFQTTRGVFAIKLPLSDVYQFLMFCAKYQVQGIRESNTLYCFYKA